MESGFDLDVKLAVVFCMCRWFGLIEPFFKFYFMTLVMPFTYKKKKTHIFCYRYLFFYLWLLLWLSWWWSLLSLALFLFLFIIWFLFLLYIFSKENLFNQEKLCTTLLSPCLLIQVSCQKAKENFELALEVDNSNAHARYWLSRLHLKYHVPGQCKAM